MNFLNITVLPDHQYCTLTNAGPPLCLTSLDTRFLLLCLTMSLGSVRFCKPVLVLTKFCTTYPLARI